MNHLESLLLKRSNLSCERSNSTSDWEREMLTQRIAIVDSDILAESERTGVKTDIECNMTDEELVSYLTE